MRLLKRWDQVLSTDETNSVVRDLALMYAREICNPALREEVSAAILCDDFLTLCTLEPDLAALSASDALNVSQALAFYRKRSDIDIGIDKEAVAAEKFEKSESLCRETNDVFKSWAAGGFQFHPRVESILYRSQRKIAQLLGDVPSLSEIKPRFGPGATTQLTKRVASARSKLSQTLSCSEDFVPCLNEALEDLPLWVSFLEKEGSTDEVALVDVEIHNGRLDFVPKNAKTHRSIVVEPMLNSFFQLGIGDYIAQRLRIRGVDIRDQTRNQKLAREGSVTGLLATLDLSSASDTVARELVAHLLPIDWFVLLDRMRTSHVEYRGQTRKLHKFSSMGNGFTFPLETLIFWAISESCAESFEGDRRVSVYGDDIIVPVKAVPLVREVLHVCGFLLNSEKSFWSGPFRESCGKDYHSGILIRPVFLKDRLSGESAFTLHNFFVRNGDSRAASAVRDILGPEVLLFGPDGYGDGHLIGVHGVDYSLAPYKRDCQYGGYTFDTFTWKSRKSYRPLPGDYVYAHYSTYTSEDAYRIDENVYLPQADGRRLVFKPSPDLLSSGLTLSSREVGYSKNGSFGVVLPGVEGFKRISIYTLTPP